MKIYTSHVRCDNVTIYCDDNNSYIPSVCARNAWNDFLAFHFLERQKIKYINAIAHLNYNRRDVVSCFFIHYALRMTFLSPALAIFRPMIYRTTLISTCNNTNYTVVAIVSICARL